MPSKRSISGRASEGATAATLLDTARAIGPSDAELPNCRIAEAPERPAQVDCGTTSSLSPSFLPTFILPADPACPSLSLYSFTFRTQKTTSLPAPLPPSSCVSLDTSARTRVRAWANRASFFLRLGPFVPAPVGHLPACLDSFFPRLLCPRLPHLFHQDGADF
jgi:hypothetical protein